MYLESKELEKMLNLQVNLNEKYSGKDWAKRVSPKQWKYAIFTEVAEFLESSPEQWKWWRTDLKNDIQNIYVEIVDVIHFSFSYMIQKHGIEFLLNYNDFINETDINQVDDNIIYYMNHFFDNPRISNFYRFIMSMVKFANVDDNKLWNIYKQKNKINNERVEGGYKEGKYQKIQNGEEDNRKIKV